MKDRRGNLVTWLILGVLGVLLIAFRETIKDIFYIVMGVGLILAAVSSLVSWWKNRQYRKTDISSVLGSAVLLVIGIWIITNPARFDSLINWVIGIILIVTGLQWVIRGWNLGRDILMICIGVIPVILGIIVIASNAATGWPIIVEGIGLIYTAVSGFVGERKFGKYRA